MSRQPTKDELDTIEAQEAQIEAERAEWDDMIAYGHIPGYSQFGFPFSDDDAAAYVGPVLAVDNEADMDSSPEDWSEFLRKIEEDLNK